MVEWHREGLSAEDIQKIIREGRDKNDNTIFNDYGDYVNYIYKDNERILDNHDHSQCEPNEETKAAMDEAKDFEVKKNAMIDFQELLDELRKDREERDDRIYRIALESIEKNKDILNRLGSDYDKDGVPYWKKWDDEKH